MVFTPGGILLMVVCVGMAMLAQWRVKSAYSKYSQIGVRSGLTGADIARLMMREENIDDVSLEMIPGELTDHYDPQAKTVRLSEAVYHGRSIAALGIAAHEVGHVIQHARGYAPMHVRSLVYPVASIGSTLGVPLAIGGFFLSSVGFGWLIWAGILLYAGAVAFTVVTLPVEYNASSRAMHALAQGGVMDDAELNGARSVLNAAALTYVAAAATAALQLLHLILLAQSRD